ncbi:hypothetical protein BJ165DRAFT_1351691, partial [Panaeolus papilionaceus]
TGEGTSNIKKTAIACLRDQGINNLQATKKQPIVVPYSSSNHRAVLALRTAQSNRPFNMVTDEYYLMEVSLLRPNTIVPGPSTISRDIKLIYLELSKHVKLYFEV